MPDKPLVSVIIPAYNAEKYIADAIQCVLNQTWRNIELIIVNDGSTDNTENVIRNFLEDKRITYITQANIGCSGAKNVGLSLTTGDFIQYLDADDILSLDKIEEQVKILHNEPFTIAICKTKIFHEKLGDNREEIDSDLLYTTNDPFGFALNLYGLNGRNGMIQPNAFLISRQLSDVIGDWDTTISPSPDEDGEYFCRAILKAHSICITAGINYYRKPLFSKNSLSTKRDHLHAKGLLGSLILKTNNLLAIENSERVKKTMAVHFASFIYSYNPLYPDLSKKAEEYIYGIGLKKIPAVGGTKFKKAVLLIGFKNALKIKEYVLSKILRR
jgi:glycosyltransferase involved in cell wall biosynthesis